MIIAAITEKYSKEQLTKFFPGEGIDWRLSPAIQPVDGAGIYIDLDFVNEKKRCEELSKLQPALIIVNAVTPTTKDIGYPFVRINAWPGFLERNIHELAVADETAASRVATLYRQLDRDYRIVPDEPGMISARILAAMINEAFFTWEAGVSTKEEIDTAMRLGTNYPLGPFEWSDRIGPGQIAGLLGALSRTNPAYVPSAALLEAVGKIKI
ncbi:MAG TPA: 3-hydroxyacyl-CoA dehydrogenase family protein [Puia sp.]|uniref:3-hydroxyacyl-CoA dehydrogenase family protein n=1 Tax=Puia sp. TaxID=2045100 RepID=UPI002C38A1BC|nr:3-hydroxyacyl-CoA dehydrogenase family protein [Puia sp.]HVU98861.1 3-hydroxyacyl-CoA dehydrogenase family protein [Puia sp.]